MRKLLLGLVMIMGVTAGANAQEPGQMWVGGSVGFNTSKTTGLDRHTDYKILPEFGYVLTDNLGIGVQLGYKHEEYGTPKQKANGFEIAPFVRYSFLKGDIGGLFIDGGAGYSYLKVKDGAKTNTFDVGLRPGIALNISDRITLTGKFGFLGYQYDKTGSLKTNKFGFDFDLSNILLGMNIAF